VAELHPLVLDFAVALLLVAPVCDVLGLATHREALLWTGRWNTLSVLTGLAAEAALGPHSAAGEALLHIHKALGYVMLVLCLPVAGWRAGSKLPLPRRARTLYLAGSFAVAAVVLTETVLGETMVYRHGVGLSPAARAEPVVGGGGGGGRGPASAPPPGHRGCGWSPPRERRLRFGSSTGRA
jgi:uncharacterized membrane protein